MPCQGDGAHTGADLPLWGMRFTEHEMTTALAGVAKEMLSRRHKEVRKGRVDVDRLWEEMDRYQRFKILDVLGGQLLPVLQALPEVDVEPGTSPAFTDQQVLTAVEECVGEGGGRLRRKAAVAGRVAMVRVGLRHLPPRSGPPAGIVEP